MKENLTGLLLSGLLHAAVLGWAVNASYLPPKEKIERQKHQLNVSLFQTKKIIRKPSIKKIEPPAPVPTKIIAATPPPKEKLAQPKPETISKPKLAKPIVVATLKPEVAIEKTIIKPRKHQKKTIQKLTKKTLRKLKKPLKKSHKKTTLKNKKRIKKVRKSKPKIIKKRALKRPAIKQVSRSKPRLRTKSRIAKSKIAKPRIAKPRLTKPKRKPTVRSTIRKVQHKPRITPAPRRTIRKTPAIKKYVKRGGMGINRYKTPSNIKKYSKQHNRQQAIRTHQTYKKPVRQYHKAAPAKKTKPVNSALIANLNKQYKARLHQLIASVTRKNYPKRAKRRNQQGRVKLAFTISHSGTITNIRILKSSSTASLDKAALQAIRKISHRLPFLRGMPKKSLNLKMTVAYVLK